jgi:Flp pilus assembly protein TadG
MRRIGGRLRDETGQALVLTGILIVILLGFAAFAVDLGNAFFAQRELQRSVDAAALAGAQELPDPAAVRTLAAEYGPADGAKNPLKSGRNTVVEVTTRCIASAPGCEPVNAVAVNGTTTVRTYFARVLGIDDITVHAKATACSPCSSKPIDLMLVLDRTGSMCQNSGGGADPTCADLNNARTGMRNFLKFFDPALTEVGFAAFPPAAAPGHACDVPQTTNYHGLTAAYVLVPLSDDYRNQDGTLNENSSLVSTINCTRANGRTAYAFAIEEAQEELERNGRPDVPNVIVFFSDGAANIGPKEHQGTSIPPSSPHRLRPCRQGVDSAATAKSRGTIVYSIGYDLDALGGGANRCERSTFYSDDDRSSPTDELPPITAMEALQQIASDSTNFFNKPDPGQLNTIFTRIAADILRPSSRLVDDNA